MLTESQLRTDIMVKGFAVRRAAVSAELLDAVRAEAIGLVDGFYAGDRSGPDYWSYPIAGRGSPVLYRIHNLERQSGITAISGLFARGPLHGIAAEALGEPAFPTVCAGVVKVPGVGASVPWHRDRAQAEVAPGRAVNLSLYLHRSTPASGCLEVVSASQTLEPGIDVESWRLGMPTTPVPAEAGDVTVHDVRLVHGSGPNPGTDLCIRIVIEFRAETLPAALLLANAQGTQ
ncbi:MAG TPA: phytanoyl-CoA dioxygenase family protein [Streptosporangiaceae bacterium]|nr:phytanoyl-CoA dioxygenase family protein [Streptosporangiaceae bacterium]